MSTAICGIEPARSDPGCRFAHPGYACYACSLGSQIAGSNWCRLSSVRHQLAVERRRLGIGGDASTFPSERHFGQVVRPTDLRKLNSVSNADQLFTSAVNVPSDLRSTVEPSDPVVCRVAAWHPIRLRCGGRFRPPTYAVPLKHRAADRRTRSYTPWPHGSRSTIAFMGSTSKFAMPQPTAPNAIEASAATTDHMAIAHDP